MDRVMSASLRELDTLALTHKGPWTTFERLLYDLAVKLLGGRNTKCKEAVMAKKKTAKT